MSDLAGSIRRDLRRLSITEGPRTGEPLVVLPWQDEIVQAVADYPEIGFTIARGNGKTTFIAGLAISALHPDGALFVPRGQVIIAASSFQQAALAFNHIRFFMWDTIYDEAGKPRPEWRIQDDNHQKSITHRKTGTYLRVIGSDAKRAHGLAPSFLILDEPAKWEGGGEELYVALETAMSKQANPKLLVIGTKPDDDMHWFSRFLREGSQYRWVRDYSADKADIEAGREYDLDVVRKANPSYDHLVALQKYIAKKQFQAQQEGGTARASYIALCLNMGTSETDSVEMIVSAANWQAVVTPQPAPRQGPLAIGYDPGGGGAMSALAFYWPETGRLEALASLPAEPPLLQRGRDDGAGDAYVKMHERGELVTYPGKAAQNKKFLMDHLKPMKKYKWLSFGADNYDKLLTQQAITELGVREDKIEWRRMGAGADGKEDIEGFQFEILDGHLSVAYNLAIEYAIFRSRLRRDRNNNPFLDKSKQKSRIDVLSACVIAVAIGHRWRVPAEPEHEFRLDDYVLIPS